MKRKFLVLISIVVILALACSSCEKLKDLLPDSSDLLGDDICEHTYSDKWSTNATEHWHAATCEHAELKADVASHTDADENGKCDVCDYQIGHEHTYAEAWTSDETHHWKAATCSHSDQKGELAAHVDADSNGSCDVCTAHVHVVNIYGKCTICDEQVSDPDITNIEIILPILVSNANKVVSGSIAYENLVTSVAEASYIKSTELVEYKLGVGTAYYNLISTTLSEGTDWEGQPYKYEFTDYLEKWYEAEGEGVVGVYRYNFDGIPGDFVLDTVSPKEVLDGYYYAVSTLADGYGAEDILATLYNLAKSDSASEFVSAYEDGVYTFSFNYLAVNSDTGEGEGNHVDYYEVSVSFTASESGVLTSLDIECDCYTNSLEDEADNDYTYDQNSNTITMKDTAVADTYTFVVSQTEGTRNYVPEYTKSDFVPEDFDVFVDEELTTELGATVTVTEGSTLYLYLGNFAPAGTSSTYIADTYICNLEVYTWIYNDSIGIPCQTAGEYSVEISLGGKTISFTLVVEAEQSGGSGDVELGDNEILVETTDTYGFFDEYTFVATGAGTYTFNVPAGLGFYSAEAMNKWADAEVGFYDNESGATVSVDLAEGEEYVYFVGALTKGQWVISYTYTAGSVGGGDNVDADDLVIGNNSINNYDVNFAYTAPGAGKLTLSVGAAIMGNVDIVYSVNGGATSTLALESSVELTLEAGDKLLISVTSEGYATLAAAWDGPTAGGDGEEVTLAQGTYTGTDGYGSSPLTVVIDDTTVTFNFNHPMMGPSSVTATYAIVDGAVVLYDEDGAVLNPLAGSLTIDANGVPTAAEYNGTSYTLAAGGSTGGDDGEEVTLAQGTYTGTDDYGNSFLTVVIDDTTVTFNFNHPMMGPSSVTATYAIVDGAVVLYDEDGEVLNPLAGALTIDANGVPTAADYNGTGYTLAAGGSTGGDDVGGDDDGVEEEKITTSGTIYDDEENTIILTDDDLVHDAVYYSFMPYQTGNYNFLSWDLSVAYVLDGDNYPIYTNDDGYYGLESYTQYILVIELGSWLSAGEFTLTPEYIYPEGHQNNPLWLFGTEGTLSHAGGYTSVWYSYYPDTTGALTVSTDAAGVTVLIGASADYAVEGEGTVTLNVIKGRNYYIGFFASEAVEISFELSFVEGEVTTDGSLNCAHDVVEGANSVEIEAYGFVYFTYMCEGSGTLSLTTDSESVWWNVIGMTEYGNADISVELEYGDVIFIYVENGANETATISFNASFESSDF